jgi:hypothetical protein
MSGPAAFTKWASALTDKVMTEEKNKLLVAQTPIEKKHNWITTPSKVLAEAVYPQKCERGYQMKLKAATNFVHSGCFAGAIPTFRSCEKEFGQAPGVWKGVQAEPQRGCGVPELSVLRQCMQTKWPIENKDKCCAGTIDNRTLCDPTWCPMSKGCGDTDMMVKHCGVKWGDKSRILSDPNCKNWCRDFPAQCDRAKIDYCSKYPGAPECKCIAPQHQKSFRRIMKQAASIGIPSPVAPSYCWYEGCAGEDLVDILKTTNIINGEKACPANSSTICTQIIQFQKGSSNNVVDGNDFTMTCGKTLPAPAHDPRDVIADGIQEKIHESSNAVTKRWNRLSQKDQMVVASVGMVSSIMLLMLLIRSSG